MANVASQTRQPRRPATAPGSMNPGSAPSLSASSSTHGSRPLRSSPLAGPVLSRTPSRRSLDGTTRDNRAVDYVRTPGTSSALTSGGTSSPDASSSSFSLLPASKRGKDSPKDKSKSTMASFVLTALSQPFLTSSTLVRPPPHQDSSAMSSLNFFRRPSSTVGHSSTGHSTASHSSSSATTHSTIFTHSTSSTQLTQCSTSPTNPAFPPPALTHSRTESLRSRPASRPVSFVEGGDPTSASPRSTSMPSHVKRPFPVVRSHSSTPTASPSTYRSSTLNPNPHHRSRTSTNADNWNPLWASVTSTVPTNTPKTTVPSKSSAPTSAASKSPFGPAEVPRFSRSTLKEAGVVMPVSAKDWRRRRSVALPGPSDSPNGWNARSVDKGKGREQRVSFVDGSARGPQIPTVQVIPDATQPPADVVLKVHPPSPTSDVLPSEPVAAPATVAVKPEVAVAPDTEQQKIPTPSATPAHESQVLSSKASTNTFFSCTSDVSPPSPASLPIPPPSPATSSSLFPSSDAPSEDKLLSAVRPRPRPRRQSSPQSMSTGNRLSFVDAMMRLSVGSFGSFSTAQSGGSEGGDTSEIEGDQAPKDVHGDSERVLLARTRSLDDLASSFPHSTPPSSPVPVQAPESVDVDVAHAIWHASPARFPDHPPRRVSAEWLDGVPRGFTAVPNYSMPFHTGGTGESQASEMDVRINGGDASIVGVANEGITRDKVDEKAEADVPDKGNDRGQNMPAQASQAIPRQAQKKRKLTKSRPASISLPDHRPDAPTQSAEPGSGSVAMPTIATTPAGPSVHGALKHAPTVLSTIVEDASSHGHGGSSNGHGQEQERVNANGLPYGKGREDSAARHTALDTLLVVESIPAKTVPSQVGLKSPKRRTPSIKGDVREIAAVTKVDVNAPSKANSIPFEVGTPRRAKRFSFLLPILSFGKSRSKSEVRDGDGSAASANVTLGTYQAGVGPGDVVSTPRKGGKMRRQGPDASIPLAPNGANTTFIQSGLDTKNEPNTLPETHAIASTDIATLPQGSEITLVASPSLYASSSSALPFTTVSPPSLFGSVPGSAASSIRIPATARSVNPIPAPQDIAVKSTVDVVLCVDEPGSKIANSLCLTHKLSHGHLFKDDALTTTNVAVTDMEAIGVADAGRHVRPTSALLVPPRPGTSSSTLTMSSDDASFSTVPLPNPWDGDAVPSPVRPVAPEPQLQAHYPCPMCGCSSPPKVISQLPVQQFFDPRSTVGVAAAPSPDFASYFLAPQVQTPAHLQQSSVRRSLAPSPSHFQRSASTSPRPLPTSPHSPRKLKRPQTSPDLTPKRGSSRKVGSRRGEGNPNVSASAVYLPVLPKVQRESKVRGVLRGLFGMA